MMFVKDFFDYVNDMVFGDTVITKAIIDRIIHHCTVIKINGISYRLKGKQIFYEDKKPTF